MLFILLQFFVVCANEEAKFEALCNIYGVISIGQAMVFCQVPQVADMSVAMVTWCVFWDRRVRVRAGWLGRCIKKVMLLPSLLESPVLIRELLFSTGTPSELETYHGSIH